MNQGHDRRWILWVGAAVLLLHWNGVKLPLPDIAPSPSPNPSPLILPAPSREMRDAVAGVKSLCAAANDREAVRAIAIGWSQFGSVLVANKQQIPDVARAKDAINQYINLDASARGLGKRVDGYGPAVEKSFVDVFGKEGDKANVDKLIEFVAALAEIN